MNKPHQNISINKVNCAIITISDTRDFDSDKSGQLIRDLLVQQSHDIVFYQIIKDNSDEIKLLLNTLIEQSNIDVIVCNGGTGISHRDNTYDVISQLLDKTLSGFGEIFRYLSYQEIGSRAIASRAVAGVYQGKIIFSLPGSTGAVKLGMEQLILPELTHLVSHISENFSSN